MGLNTENFGTSTLVLKVLAHLDFIDLIGPTGKCPTQVNRNKLYLIEVLCSDTATIHQEGQSLMYKQIK